MIKKKSTMTAGLLNVLEKHAETALTDLQRVRIAKNKYLMANREEILQAVAEDYPHPFIAEAATIELLKTGVPTEFSFTNKDGEEIVQETRFVGSEIRSYCEAIEA